MRITVVGPYFANGNISKHNCEVGVFEALQKLGHEVNLYDPRSDRYIQNSPTGTPGDVDIILCPGCGTQPKVFDMPWWYHSNALKVNWNSEPLRLPEYMSKLSMQASQFDFFFTFDESEIPLYNSLGIEKVAWLPQAYHPAWYKPLDTPPIADICFVGSVGGKWLNRVHLIQRLQKSFAVSVVQGLFDAEMVNRVYNCHKLVLNLGLFTPQSGPVELLRGFGYQQRIFEAIGSHKISITNEIDTPHLLFGHKEDILYYTANNIEEIVAYGLKESTRKEMEYNISKVSAKHTYESRMKEMLEILEKMT